MESYEVLGKIGEGTYGIVLKCRHKESGQLVAIKIFKESDEDEQVRKTALREVRILKTLKHDNIVHLIEVFRNAREGKLFLVFEYAERTVLEDLEQNPDGMDPVEVKKTLWQLLRSIAFCHAHHVIHRDIKPENLLITHHGVLKLCDFGFARTLAAPGGKYTDYVSTRWYRAPELLVGDTSYGEAVDIWAIGCMLAEMSTGVPLFPGDSDIDQLFLIMRCCGSLTERQRAIFHRNPLYVNVKLPEVVESEPLHRRFRSVDPLALDFLQACLGHGCDEQTRPSCAELLQHPYFDGLADWFEPQLQQCVAREREEFVMLPRKRRNKRNRSLLASGQDQGEGKSSWAGAAGGESRPRGMTELKTPRGGPKGVTWDESVAEDKRAGAEGKTTEGGGGNPLPSLTPAPPGLSPRLGYEARTEGQDPAMGRPPAHGKAAYSRRGRREKDPPRHGRDPGRSHRSKSRRARDPSTEHDGSKTAESSPSDWAGDGRDPDDATSTTSRSRRRGKSRHRRRDRDRDRERPSPSRGASRRGRHHRHGRPPSQHGGEGAQSSSQEPFSMFPTVRQGGMATMNLRMVALPHLATDHETEEASARVGTRRSRREKEKDRAAAAQTGTGAGTGAAPNSFGVRGGNQLPQVAGFSSDGHARPPSRQEAQPAQPPAPPGHTPAPPPSGRPLGLMGTGYARNGIRMGRGTLGQRMGGGGTSHNPSSPNLRRRRNGAGWAGGGGPSALLRPSGYTSSGAGPVEPSGPRLAATGMRLRM